MGDGQGQTDKAAEAEGVENETVGETAIAIGSEGREIREARQGTCLIVWSMRICRDGEASLRHKRGSNCPDRADVASCKNCYWTDPARTMLMENE